MVKASGQAIGAGCFLMLIGLCFLPAALQQRNDPSILGAGVCLFSFGALIVSGGLYLRARVIQSAMPAVDLRKLPGRRLRAGCDVCGSEAPIIQCRVHEVHLCGQCVGDHYDFRSCAYVPSPRRAQSHKSLARMAAKA